LIPPRHLELTTVELQPGAEKAFESALGAEQSKLQNETPWYRMIEGGSAPRYVRLRPGPSITSLLDGKNEQALPDKVNMLITKITIEVLNLRPAMCYGVAP
jgi:hypothetical protein